MKVKKNIPSVLVAKLVELAPAYKCRISAHDNGAVFTVEMEGDRDKVLELFAFVGEPVEATEAVLDCVPRRFCHTLMEVDAIRYNGSMESGHDIENFSSGRFRYILGYGLIDSEVLGLRIPAIEVGMWIVKISDGKFETYTDENFRRHFEPKDGEMEAARVENVVNDLEAENATLRKELAESKKREAVAAKVIESKNARKGLTFAEYQARAMSTCLPEAKNAYYMLFGLAEEVGELQGKIAKAIRKGLMRPEAIEPDETLTVGLQKECGDVLWMLQGLCSVMGWTLEDVARMNLDKLAGRKAEGTITDHKDH